MTKKRAQWISVAGPDQELEEAIPMHECNDGKTPIYIRYDESTGDSFLIVSSEPITKAIAKKVIAEVTEIGKPSNDRFIRVHQLDTNKDVLLEINAMGWHTAGDFTAEVGAKPKELKGKWVIYADPLELEEGMEPVGKLSNEGSHETATLVGNRLLTGAAIIYRDDAGHWFARESDML